LGKQEIHAYIVGKPDGKRLLGRLEDDIKLDRETQREDGN
jgi:hypothetical protein